MCTPNEPNHKEQVLLLDISWISNDDDTYKVPNLAGIVIDSEFIDELEEIVNDFQEWARERDLIEHISYRARENQIEWISSQELLDIRNDLYEDSLISPADIKDWDIVDDDFYSYSKFIILRDGEICLHSEKENGTVVESELFNIQNIRDAWTLLSHETLPMYVAVFTWKE